MFDVVIVGGGITGLAAAWMLEQQGVANYALLEASPEWGGKMASRVLNVDGKAFLVDGGPDTLLTRKAETWQLATALGLEDELVVPAGETRNIYVLDGGVVHALPLSSAKFLSTRLLSIRGRLRMLLEPFIPARRDDGDESLLSFASRRLGREAAEKMIGPVLGGIYNADPANQSVLVSSPLMRQMERDGGSLVMGSFKRAGIRRPLGKDGKPIPRSINFRQGMAQLPHTIAASLQGRLQTNTAVKEIRPLGNAYELLTATSETIQTRQVILAVLANAAAPMLQGMAPALAAQLGQIPHKNIGTATLIYKQADLPAKPAIFGLMIPRREQRDIDAVVLTSAKLPSRGHAGYAMVRVFFGGAKPTLLHLPEADLLAALRAELAALMGITAAPLAHTVFSWQAGFPQANVGHLQHVAQIEQNLPAGLWLAGSSYRGIAVPDCIKQGCDAAKAAATETLKTL